MTIQDHIKQVELANGGAFVRAPINATVRSALEGLATGFGIAGDVAERISAHDLTVLYASARKATNVGAQVAQRIAGKYAAHNPLLDPPLAPEPPAEPPASPPNLDALKRTIERAVEDELARKTAEILLTARQDAEKAAGREAGDVARDVARNSLEAFTQVALEAARVAVQEQQPTNLVVTLPNSAPVPVGLVHRKTVRIIKMLARGHNVYLHGPAGSGKTTVAQKCAEAFGLQFYFAAKVADEFALLGYQDVRGETVRTQFRDAYEYGGVFLFDELDASSPQAIVALNAALANGICPFPDGLVARHPDFKCIGAGNTTLGGATMLYQGRQALDGASVDRFAFLHFPYDEQLELTLATNRDWCAYVQAVRAEVAKRELPFLVSPRATISGCEALADGDTWEEAEENYLWKGLDPDTVAQLKRAVAFAMPQAA